MSRKPKFTTHEERLAAQRESARRYRTMQKLKKSMPGIDGPQVLLAALYQHELDRQRLIEQLEIELEKLKKRAADDMALIEHFRDKKRG